MAVSLSLAIEASWSQWCGEFFAAEKKRIERVVEVAQASGGQPVISQLKERIAGIEAVIAALYGEKASVAARANALVISQLEDLASQEWLHPM